MMKRLDSDALYYIHNIYIYTTFHINEAISLVLVRMLLEYTARMTSNNNKTFSEQFRALLMYKTNRFYFAV